MIEAILVGFHWFWSSIGLEPEAGLTWVLSIVGLVLVVRAALIPIFVRQIKSQRKMLEVAPQLKKIQDKYNGKKDQFSREAMQRETMELYRKAGTNPFSSCLPLLHPDADLLQPVLGAERGEAGSGTGISKPGVGLLTEELTDQFGNASLFGIAPLKHSIQTALAANPVEVAVVVIAAVMVVAHDGLAVHHAAADHVEEPVARDEGQPDVPPAADPAVHPPAGVRVLGLRVPDRRDVLLAHLEHLDDGPAVPRHPEHADAGQRGGARARGAPGQAQPDQDEG